MKRLWGIPFLLLCLFVFVAGTEAREKANPSCGNLYVPRGPILFSVVPLRHQMVFGPEIVLWSSPEEIIALLVSGEVECALLPITLGAAIHTKGFPMILLGVTQWDLFHFLVPPGVPSDSLKELENESLYLPFGRGTTADVLVRSALRREGLVPEVNVRLLYGPPQEILGLLGAGKARYAVLPEPFTSLALTKENVVRGLPLRRLWQEEAGEEAHLPVTGLFVSRKSFEKDPERFRTLEHQYLLSLKWAESHLSQAADLLRRDLPLPREVLEAALKGCDFTYSSGCSADREVRRFYEYLCSQAPEACGGVPEKEFFCP